MKKVIHSRDFFYSLAGAGEADKEDVPLVCIWWNYNLTCVEYKKSVLLH